MRRLLNALNALNARSGAGVAGLLALLFLLPAPAAAHTALQDAAPGPGDTVAPGVTVVALTLADLKPGTTPAVGVLGPDGSAVATGPAAMADEGTACVAVAPLGAGVHTIVYTAVAADEDEQTNRFSFEVAAGAGPAATPAACRTAQPAAPGAGDTVLGVERATATAALASAGAACALAALLLGRGGRRRHRRPARRHRRA
ncbi:copper resistance protein CopC [Streptomyces aidingensis]|uniref:CopC domain-containing protein n=1 Tax=Streptomyces aidingensis TaxID=910347 RepID=A0A1I1V622_9ACTN|nr:copper resistance protein CopC [Streptomyces aidingensis]SFD76533.1 hypothetical protein SAMN05421773_1294 [Streptomyces aidingensis]